ncbi:MAG: L-glutamate gamma-semialdehyde dehydrogenase, partial [Bacteroidales bacterium]|nr:L-glutamate gamma-semialdehyde dehydrogenase [Bacteroidales bacterium]
IKGKEIRSGNTGKIINPGSGEVLATYNKAGKEEVQKAINSAINAHKIWSGLSWVERMSINLKAAELISKKYRYLINASTMLGQGKNAYQAEIDAVCETIDFLKFNAYYVSQIYNDQPISANETLNRIEYRPLEGFVFTVSPFNFTAIASNLVMAPVILGNVVVWKPATTSLLSNYYLMKIFQEAGIPDGVINFIPGEGSIIGDEVLKHRDLAGIHFTGSNNTFNRLWKGVAHNLENYKSYPRVVGETGGKDFVFVHPSADSKEVATALVRGAFEYQGQKCSAASRAYIPHSLWSEVKNHMSEMILDFKIGPVNDFQNFINPVIDQSAFDRIKSYIDYARNSKDAEVIFGGHCYNSKGFYIDPTVIETSNPHFKTMEEEIFGPVLTIFTYADSQYEETLEKCDQTSPYGLTGSIFSNDRYAMLKACQVLRYSAGNFYINDKPTGAVVGQQPFGGSRSSGTNDKAGSYLNLLKWVSPRTIKENFLPPSDYKYPFMIENKCKF